MDFTKAFDSVVREVIWYKLIKIGVRGKILNIIMSMYKHVKSKVKINNSISIGFECNLGVRQGECLSPFLFAMYIYDLEEEFHLKGSEGIDLGMLKIFLLLYADDIIIFASSAVELQNNLNILSEYCERYKLVVNTTKTKIMVFRRGGFLSKNLKFYYNETEIAIVNTFSYLDIVFLREDHFQHVKKHYQDKP